jgi:hypothetical protein
VGSKAVGGPQTAEGEVEQSKGWGGEEEGDEWEGLAGEAGEDGEWWASAGWDDGQNGQNGQKKGEGEEEETLTNIIEKRMMDTYWDWKNGGNHWSNGGNNWSAPVYIRHPTVSVCWSVE